MAVRFALFLAFAAGAASVDEQSDYPCFEDHVKEHGLSYSAGELPERARLFREAVEDVKAQNDKRGGSWKAAVNEFATLNPKEREYLFGYSKAYGQAHSVGPVPRAPPHRDVPSNHDWRDVRPSVVTAVKNQGQCGSCWAVASTSVLESAIAIATGSLFDLTPQQIVSCAPNPDGCGGYGGCTGGTAAVAFNYTIQKGITSVWKWPYTSGLGWGNGDCFATIGKKRPVAGISGYVAVPRNDASALMHAALVSPVVVTVAASDWAPYSSGIFDGCDTKRPLINHAVTLMGYGEDKGFHYWLVRNSWGVTWGENGYIRLQRFPEGEPCGVDDEKDPGYSCFAHPVQNIKACGMCGILSDSAYPTGAFLGAPQEPEDPAIDTSKVVSQQEALPRAATDTLRPPAVPAQKGWLWAAVPFAALAALLPIAACGARGAFRQRCSGPLVTSYSEVATGRAATAMA